MNEVDIWVLYDNNDRRGVRIAFGGKNIPIKVNDKVTFNKVKNYE